MGAALRTTAEGSAARFLSMKQTAEAVDADDVPARNAALEIGDPDAAKAAARQYVAKFRMRLTVARDLEKQHIAREKAAASTAEETS